MILHMPAGVDAVASRLGWSVRKKSCFRQVAVLLALWSGAISETTFCWKISRMLLEEGNLGGGDIIGIPGISNLVWCNNVKSEQYCLIVKVRAFFPMQRGSKDVAEVTFQHDLVSTHTQFSSSHQGRAREDDHQYLTSRRSSAKILIQSSISEMLSAKRY